MVPDYRPIFEAVGLTTRTHEEITDFRERELALYRALEERVDALMPRSAMRPTACWKKLEMVFQRRISRHACVSYCLWRKGSHRVEPRLRRLELEEILA